MSDFYFSALWVAKWS